MAAFLLKDSAGKVILDLTSNLSMYVETIDVVLPKGSSMVPVVRRLDTLANFPRWWCYVASGEVLSPNKAVVESYSNGVGCAIITKALGTEAGLGSSIMNQMNDTSTYLLIWDCRASYNNAYQQTVGIHLGKC